MATVPDPIDSHLAYDFDRAVDAIQNGVEDSGYVMDRLFLPWKPEPGGWDASIRQGLVDAISIRPHSASGDRFRRTPGVLLFRKNSNLALNLLLVFLVGETPTAGIQRRAFDQAMNAIHVYTQREERAHCPVRQPVQILGPYFSGSTDSLRLALTSRSPDQLVEIVSGSATVDFNKQLLGNIAGCAFHATVQPDTALTEGMTSYLTSLGIRVPTDVALLAESGTTYGSESRSSQARFVLRYPLHVSQLRGAYDKDQALRNGWRLDRGPRNTLEVPLDTLDRDPSDILPPFDTRMASAVADLDFLAASRLIRSEGVKAVGIIASDPRDVLFLGRKLGEAGSNVTLFTYGSDILYTHPDYQRFLDGMIIATPYPLFPLSQGWTGANHERLTFSSSSDEGLYNATVFAIAALAHSRPLPLDYGTPFAGVDSQPPVWLTVVGKGAFWPLTLQPHPPDTKDYVKHVAVGGHRGPELPGHFPDGSIPLFLVLEMSLVALALLFWRSRNANPAATTAATLPTLTLRAAFAARLVAHPHTTALLAYVGCVQLAILVWAFQGRTFVAPSPGKCALLIVALAVGTGLFLLFATFTVLEARLHLRSLTLKPPDTLSEMVVAAGPFVIPMVVLLYLASYLFDVCRRSGTAAIAQAARTLSLSSGVTPVLPFCLLAVVLCLAAVTDLRRAFLMDLLPRIRSSTVEPTSFAGTSELYADVLACVSSPRRRALFLLVPLVMQLPFFSLITNGYTTLDGHPWSQLLLVLLTSCYVLIWFHFTAFCVLWLRLRRLLTRLALHPLAAAFRRLPLSSAASPWSLWRTVPNLATLAESVTQLRALVNLEGAWLTPIARRRLNRLAKRAECRLTHVLGLAQESFAASTPGQAKLRAILGTASLILIQELEQVWASWPSYTAPTSAGPDGGSSTSAHGPATGTTSVTDLLHQEVTPAAILASRLAEEFVALRTTSFIRGMFQHLKNFMTFAFLGLLLVIAAVTAYPFEPKHAVGAFVWLLVLIAVTLVAWAFLDMERNVILSHIGKTVPGRITINRDLLSFLALYVVVPLLTLAATQFPGIGSIIYGVFKPAMQSVSR